MAAVAVEGKVLMMAVVCTTLSSLFTHLSMELKAVQCELCAFVSGCVAVVTGTLCLACLDVWRLGPAASHGVRSLVTQYAHLRWCRARATLCWLWTSASTNAVCILQFRKCTTTTTTTISPCRKCPRPPSTDSLRLRGTSLQRLSPGWDRVRSQTVGDSHQGCHDDSHGNSHGDSHDDSHGESHVSQYHYQYHVDGAPGLPRIGRLVTHVPAPRPGGERAFLVFTDGTEQLRQALTLLLEEQLGVLQAPDVASLLGLFSFIAGNLSSICTVMRSGFCVGGSSGREEVLRTVGVNRSSNNNNEDCIRSKSARRSLLSVVGGHCMDNALHREAELRETGYGDWQHGEAVLRPVGLSEEGFREEGLREESCIEAKMREVGLQGAGLTPTEVEASYLASRLWPCLRLVSVLRWDAKSASDVTLLRATYCRGLKLEFSVWAPSSGLCWGRTCDVASCRNDITYPTFCVQACSEGSNLEFLALPVREDAPEVSYNCKQIEEGVPYELVVTRLEGRTRCRTGYIAMLAAVHAGRPACFHIF